MKQTVLDNILKFYSCGWSSVVSVANHFICSCPHIFTLFKIAHSVRNGSNAQLQGLARWIQCTSHLLTGPIDQHMLHTGSNGQDMLCTGFSGN